MYELIKHKLEETIWFRERRNKNYGIAEILIKEHALNVNAKRLEEIIVEYASLDRQWREVTKDHPHLRGSDYEDRVRLMQEKQIELGYEVGYHNDLKQSKLL